MYRKHRDRKTNGEGPPNYKPPPPKKKNNSTNMQLQPNAAPVAMERPPHNDYYSTQTGEPVTDLDNYHDDEEDHGENMRAHYYAAAPSGWDEPGNSEVPPPYMRTDSDPQDYHDAHNVNRGDSFVSPAMFV